VQLRQAQRKPLYLKMKLSILPEIEIIEESETELESLYRVIIHNDNITPMDFVVHILKTIFYLANDRAADIMLTAHIKGNAYVQTLPKSEAERRVNKAHFEANNAGYPLKFTMEPE
jgi:ATP-dependent Clp protease adaptor protein ClpS